MEVNSQNVLYYKSEEEKKLQKQREQIVAQSNKLISRTRSQMKIRELRILLYIISKIRPDDQPGTLYRISVSDIAKLSGRKKPNYSEIRAIVNNMNRMFWIEDFEPDVDVGMVWFSIAWYRKGKGYIDFKFTEEISPYLFALKQHYTSYPLSYILPMRSQYSVRLYEVLKKSKSVQPQHEYFRIKLQELKDVMGAENYKNWKDFRKRVLEPALGEINSKPTQGEINIYSDILVSYRVEKMGRAVDSVVFHVTNKSVDEIAAIMEQNEDYLSGDIIRPEKALPRMEPKGDILATQLTLEDFVDGENLLLQEDDK